MTPNFIFRGGPFSLGWSTKTYHLCVCGRGRRGGYVSIHILKIPISRCGYKHDMSLEIRIILWVGHGMVDSVVREFSSALGKKKEEALLQIILFPTSQSAYGRKRRRLPFRRCSEQRCSIGCQRGLCLVAGRRSTCHFPCGNRRRRRAASRSRLNPCREDQIRSVFYSSLCVSFFFSHRSWVEVEILGRGLVVEEKG